MQCREARDLFDSYLAGELLTETNHAILRHLEGCPACRADLAERRTVREALQRAFGRAKDLEPRAGFSTDIATRLRDVARETPHRARFPGWLALAATLLVAIGLTGALWREARSRREGALAVAAVGDHRNCALRFSLTEKPISLAEAAQRFGPVYRALEEMPPAEIPTPLGLARVLERHSCVFAGRRFAHIVLQYRQKKVSLLVTDDIDAASAKIPPDVTFDDASVASLDGMALVSFRTNGHAIFLTGDVDRTELTTLANAVAGPLAQHLSGV
jgi:anti-sigma factor RsiW